MKKVQVLDRTKALYGLRTQAYGETNYLKEKIQVSDTTRYNHTSVHGSEARCYRKHGQIPHYLATLSDGLFWVPHSRATTSRALQYTRLLSRLVS